jgi:capsular polysaccharide biosynthesis protein
MICGTSPDHDTDQGKTDEDDCSASGSVKIDLSNIDSISAFELAPDESARTELDFNRSIYERPIRLVKLKDILYLPSAIERGQSLCLKNIKTIPKETYTDDYEFTVVQDWVRNNKINKRYLCDFDVNREDKPVCILGNIFSRDFGHWTEELLKVTILEKCRIGCYYVVADLPKFATNFLLFLGVRADRILSITEPTIFSCAMFTTRINHENIADHPSALMAFREFVQSRCGESTEKYGARLWLERGISLQNGGITLNKEEVYNCINKYEFQIVDMAALSIHDQIKTAVNANIIAGPHGAQFVHAQFMPASSVVIECFSPKYVNPSIFQICRVLRHKYHQVVSRCNWVRPYSHGRDCEIDVEHLQLILDNLVD